MKTYVLTISKHFMSGHPRAGQYTSFGFKIAMGEKIHTIRDNYKLWKKRIDNINEGKAILSLREWSGRPRRSSQVELKTYKKVGIQKIQIDPNLGWFVDDVDSDLCVKLLANNDGLTYEDFKAWFKKTTNHYEPMAIIHFTDFRY